MTTSVWQIDPQAFPEQAELSEKIKFWLKYAVLAPSAHNTQPWRWEIADNTLSVYRDPVHTLAVGDPTLRETTLGIGAFIENFIIAANHWGHEVAVSDIAWTVNDMLLAKLTVSSPAQAVTVDSALFDGLVKRHTNRGPYKPEPLASELIGVGIFAITDPAAKERIAQLVGQGTKIALSMRPMRQELSELLFREDQPKESGMMLESMMEQPPASSVDHAAWFKEQFDVDTEAAYWQQVFTTSPLHVIIGTQADGPEAWLNAGRVMERVLVMAAANGLNHSLAAAPVEIPPLAPQLRKEADLAYRPQALFRLGIPEKPEFTKYSTRRPAA
jgi:nitroreductase